MTSNAQILAHVRRDDVQGYTALMKRYARGVHPVPSLFHSPAGRFNFLSEHRPTSCAEPYVCRRRFLSAYLLTRLMSYSISRL